MSQEHQYQVMMRNALEPVTIMSTIGNLPAQWQFMRRNDCHKLWDGTLIIINYAHVVAVRGPNNSFSSMNPNPFPARS